MRSRSILGLNPKGFHRLHYMEWGSPDDPTVVCVHGLSQNAHSFDTLAGKLEAAIVLPASTLSGEGKAVGWTTRPDTIMRNTWPTQMR